MTKSRNDIPDTHAWAKAPQQELARRRELITRLFLDIRYQAEIFYEYHFGIIGVEETMEIGGIAIYSGLAGRI